MAVWPEGTARILLGEVGSTQDEARARAPALAGPAWLLARRQTGGRGRRGKAWADPPGNFAATLVLPLPDAAPLLALRSFVAALALRDALVAATGQEAAFTLKWPNDVLYRGRKIAGILLETLPAPAQGLAIGIGVNLVAVPEDVAPGARAPAHLAETGIRLEPGAFLDLLAPAFARREAVLAEEGFAPVRAAWLDHAAGLGQEVHARAGDTVHSGRFAGIHDSGALLLDTGQGRLALPAADVFFSAEDAHAALH